MSDDGESGGGGGFGIDGYIVPTGTLNQPASFTMPKAKLDAGSAFTQVSKRGPGPGPCEYFKDPKTVKSFGTDCRGGVMSKLSRSWPDGKNSSAAPVAKSSPPTTSPLNTPRVLGGPMPKKDRGSYLYDKAVAQSRHQVAPGKYTPHYVEAAPRSASFGTPRKDKPDTRPGAQIGPGHYEVKKDVCEKTLPCYSVPKNPATSFLDTLTKKSATTPGPGHNVGISVTSKVEDRAGARLHSARILADHIVTPRKSPNTTPPVTSRKTSSQMP